MPSPAAATSRQREPEWHAARHPRTWDWNSVETMQFDWGFIKWVTGGAQEVPEMPTAGIVVLLPGRSHDRHNHPESHELPYVVSGSGEQMVEDPSGEPITQPVHAGDAIRIPRGVYHSTVNTGWEPMRVLALYAPSGPRTRCGRCPGSAASRPASCPRWPLRTGTARTPRPRTMVPGCERRAPLVVLLGTLGTKGRECSFLAELIRAHCRVEAPCRSWWPTGTGVGRFRW
jgi:quercetin dioxygenase-like cupin family protein